jgi:hypothetical protein
MPISAQHTKFVYPDYIESLPADDLIKLAVKKQEMFDEGRSKVQQSIDAYGKIRNSLVRDVDKEYFDKNMNNLVKAINQNAGLDFSVKGNVDSVLNIGRPLENDATLLGAVDSAKTYNSMMEEYKKLDPKLKSPVNDYFYFKDIAAWKNNGDVGTKLNYQSYKPYQEGTGKKWGEAFSKIKPNIETQFEFTPDGRRIQKTVVSSVDQGRVRDAYMSMLTPAEMEQLQMDAQYKYLNSNQDAIKGQYQGHMNETLQLSNAQIEDLENRKVIAKQKNIPMDDPRILEIDRNLSKAYMQRDILEGRASRGLADIPDNEVINFLQDQTIFDASNAYAYTQVEKDLDEDQYALKAYESQLAIQKEVTLDRLGLSARKKDEKVPLPPGSFEVDGGFIKDTESVSGKPTGLTLKNDLLSGVGTNDLQKQQQLMVALKKVLSKGVDDKGQDIPVNVKDALLRAVLSGTWDPQDAKVIKATFGDDNKYRKTMENLKSLATGLYDIQDRNGDIVDISQVNARDANMGSGYTLVPKKDKAAEEYYLTDAGGFGFKFDLEELGSMDAMALFNAQDIRKVKPETNPN